jgi:nucleoside-diphosphate-sugar epimerase
MAPSVLVTGNLGYVGPAVIRHLRRRFPEARLVGLDLGLFSHCVTTADDAPERLLNEQRYGDVRNVKSDDLRGFDAVIHLAAVSNDPMGNRFEAVTDAINHRASIQMAEAARDAGVKHFVFASSCSVYGFAADGRPRAEGDSLDPLTAYARSKIATENGLEQMDPAGMVVSCLRFATACGMSDRLRLDLVLNDFVAGAIAGGKITVLSDGTPWRPLIDTTDMARAMEWAITRPPEQGGQFLRVNVGANSWNYQVRALAEAVVGAIPGTDLSINMSAPPDKRSYSVDFSRFAKLAPEHQPQMTLDRSIAALRDGLRAIGFQDSDFRQSQFMRLKVLERHIARGALSEALVWN